jgi:Rrf2 family protein
MSFVCFVVALFLFLLPWSEATMRISAKAEYACTAMMELAAGYGEPKPMQVTAIARSGIPERFLVQVLLQLKKANLVASVRGASGGYQLTRAPDAITLADIINAIDDTNASREAPNSFLSRQRIKPTPIVEVLLDVWREIREVEQKMLERITLAELLKRTREDNALTYQI